MESDTFDDLDRQVLHALLVDARAPFARVGQVLGVSDRTVARRYAKLRAVAGLRLTPLTDPRQVGQAHWFIRARCAPGAADGIAAALAHRQDTSWVNLLSGGTEIACAARSVAVASGGSGVQQALAHNARVVDISAQRLLHTYFGGPRNVVSKYSALSAEQIDDLRAHVLEPVEPSGSTQLDDVDRSVLRALDGDGRRPIEDLAAATGLPATTVRRRLGALRADGTLYFSVTVSPQVLAAPLRTAMWLAVAPGDLRRTGEALAGHREVAYVAATTGRTNLYASLLTHDEGELHEYLSEVVGALGTVRDLETSPVVRTLKADVAPDAALTLLRRR